jgi:hypothetical protein
MDQGESGDIWVKGMGCTAAAELYKRAFAHEVAKGSLVVTT